jgi:hypothetical protein
MKSFLEKAFAALSSFALAIVVLAFLFLLTVIGTLEQTHSSLFEVQQRYFESAFVIHHVMGVPVPLPGVYLLLVVLSVNLICGGIIRIRKHGTTVGVIVAHLGVLTMFAGAGVEFYCSQKGHATIAEGDAKAEFDSYFEWEIAVAPAAKAGPVEELVIPGHQFMRLAPGARVTFTSAALPFDLVVHDVLPNCGPRRADGATTPGVEGVALEPLKRNKEAESDIAGAYVDVLPKAGGAPVEGVLWGREEYPMSVAVEGKRWTIGMAHRRFPMPFTVRLDKFRREMHPGIGMAKSFESDVTKIQNGSEQKVKISMNAPLLSNGVKVFQSGFIEPTAGGGGKWWSTFSVVKNPADKVPLIACIVIAAGLLLHFGQKLVRHVRTQTWRRA